MKNVAAMRVHLPARFWIAAAVPFILLALGTIGYKGLGTDDWTWFDAMYMSAITVTTVGYGETHPLTDGGRLFTIFFLFGGVFLLFYAATEMIRTVVSGQFQKVLGREGVKHALEEVRDHTIVVGLGRMGRFVCMEFERQKMPYVIVDRDQALLDEIAYAHGIPLHGDATEDDVLKRAGVERAKVLVTVLPSDADNLYITLSARVVNPSLLIVARAESEAAEPKLRRVGANQVVSPYVIGGQRVAQAVLRPTVGHVLEQATRRGTGDYLIEEVVVRPASPLCGKNLRDSAIGQGLGIVVIAIKEPDGKMLYNPKGDTTVKAGYILVAVGHAEQMLELERLAAGK